MNTQNSTIKTLFNQIIDYAGMFPPAKLPMADAVENYLTYIDSNDNWMMSRLILPLGRINDLPDMITGKTDKEILVSVLGSRSEDLEGFLESIETVKNKSAHFNQMNSGKSKIDSTEIFFPADAIQAIFSDTENSKSRLIAILNEVEDNYEFFFEIPWQNGNQDLFNQIAEFLTSLENQFENVSLNLKLRTGGVTKDDFPSPAILAEFIHACAINGVKWKATAGLHHPIRSFRDEVGTEMHGFLNLLAASIAADNGEDVSVLISILNSTDPSEFKLDDEILVYPGGEAGIKKVSSIREKGFLSFGSCSFDEPREDLRDLNINI